MPGAVRSALVTPDLRKKILFTLGIVAVYRLGATLPAPLEGVAGLPKLLDALAEAGVTVEPFA